MRRHYRCLQKQLGIIIACIGVGIITVVIVPFWWWLIVVGGGIVYFGFNIMNNRSH